MDRVPIQGSFTEFASARILNGPRVTSEPSMPYRLSQTEVIPGSAIPSPEGCSLGSLLYDLDLESASLDGVHRFR
jgi:hypothetical protein